MPLAPNLKEAIISVLLSSCMLLMEELLKTVIPPTTFNKHGGSISQHVRMLAEVVDRSFKWPATRPPLTHTHTCTST